MPTQQTPKITPRLGVPSEALLRDQQQLVNEAESRRYSNLTPMGRINGGWQFAQKIAERQWTVGGMVALWLVMGVPSLALMGAGIVHALARTTPAEQLSGTAQACLVPGIPLTALAVLTRNWLQRRRFARDVRRRP